MKKYDIVLVLVAALALMAPGCNMPLQDSGPAEEWQEGLPPEEHPEEGFPPDEQPPMEPGEAHIAYFVAHRTSLMPGECTGLEWGVEGAPGATLNGEPVEPTGLREVCPPETTSYHLVVDMGDRSLEGEVLVLVEGEGEPQPPAQQEPPAAPPTSQSGPPSNCAGKPVIPSFNANPGTIAPGGSSTLSWGGVTNGASGPLVGSVVLEPGFGEVGSPGSRVVKPAKTTTYTLKGTGCGGTTTRQVTVAVNAGPSGPGGVDLAVTDLYPQNQPKGDVYARITNHGPESLVNAKVELKCTSIATNYQTGAKTTQAKDYPSSHTLSLSPGQTKAVNTSVVIDTAGQWFSFSCTLQAPGTNDPKTNNNTFSETFPPPP